MIKDQQPYKSSQPDYCLEKVIVGKLRNTDKQKLVNQRYLKAEEL
jgi:hypothetical protein